MTLKNSSAADALITDLVQQIESGALKPGDAIVSERTLAQQYEISHMTVRRALAELVRGGVLYSRPRQGTFVSGKPIRARFGHDQRTLAVLCYDLGNWIDGAILSAVERLARQHGFQVLVANAALDVTAETAILDQLTASGIAGIIALPVAPPFNAGAYARLHAKGIPLVLVDRYFPDLDIDNVTADNGDAAKRAIRYLYDLGHRRIGLLNANPEVQRLTSVAERAAGFAAGAAECGLDEEHLEYAALTGGQLCHLYRRTNLAELGYTPMVKSFLRPAAKRTTGWVLVNSAASPGVLRAATELQLRVPEDVSLIACDDSEFTDYMAVSLTAMTPPLEAIGSGAVQLLLDRIGGHKGGRRDLRYPNELTVRKSCGLLQRSAGGPADRNGERPGVDAAVPVTV